MADYVADISFYMHRGMNRMPAPNQYQAMFRLTLQPLQHIWYLRGAADGVEIALNGAGALTNATDACHIAGHTHAAVPGNTYCAAAMRGILFADAMCMLRDEPSSFGAMARVL